MAFVTSIDVQVFNIDEDFEVYMAGEVTILHEWTRECFFSSKVLYILIWKIIRSKS